VRHANPRGDPMDEIEIPAMDTSPESTSQLGAPASGCRRPYGRAALPARQVAADDPIRAMVVPRIAFADLYLPISTARSVWRTSTGGHASKAGQVVIGQRRGTDLAATGQIRPTPGSGHGQWNPTVACSVDSPRQTACAGPVEHMVRGPRAGAKPALSSGHGAPLARGSPCVRPFGW